MAARRVVPPSSTSGATQAGADGLTAFLAEAERRRERHSREAGQRPADWADPDPHAALLLPHSRQPVERAARRHRPGECQRNYLDALRRCCALLLGVAPRDLTDEDVAAYPWHHLDPDAATDYRHQVYTLYRAQTTRNDKISVVRRVVIQCCKAGLISPLRRDAVLDELYTITPGTSTRRRRITSSEVAALLAAAEQHRNPRTAARDTAMIALLWTSGIRIGELAKLNLDDWDRDADVLLLRATKNGRNHVVYLHPAAIPYLDRWVAHRSAAPGALFTAIQRPDTRPLNTETLRYIMRRRATEAGVPRFGCHDFRRSFATALLRTHDPVLVGKLLNHTKLSSTMVYDLSAEEEQRDAVGQLFLPPLDSGAPTIGTGRGDRQDG